MGLARIAQKGFIYEIGSAAVAAAMTMPLVLGVCMAGVAVIRGASEAEHLRTCTSASAHAAARDAASRVRSEAATRLSRCFPNADLRTAIVYVRGIAFLEVSASARIEVLPLAVVPVTIRAQSHAVVEHP